MKEFVGLCPKPSYLKDNNDESKKAISKKNCVIKSLKFQDFKNCLKFAQIINKVNYL